MSIEEHVEGKTFVSVSTLKLKTGLCGRRIAHRLGKLGYVRYTKGKTPRPIWIKETEQ